MPFLSRDLLEEADSLVSTGRTAVLANQVRQIQEDAQQEQQRQASLANIVSDLKSRWSDTPAPSASGVVGQPSTSSPAGGFDLSGVISSLKSAWAPPKDRTSTTPAQPGVAGARPLTARGAAAAMPSGYAGQRGTPDGGVEQWNDPIGRASSKYKVPPSIIKSIMQIESGGNPQAVSSAGALGLMQTMPFHYQAGENGMDPETNIDRGTKILADNFARYGDWDRAAAAYFGAIDGQGNITNATDGSSVDGHAYVRLFNDARARYEGAPNAGAAQPSATAVSPPAPAAAVSPAPSAAGAPKFRIRDEWGNEGEMTQAQLDRRPGGYADLTILGPATSQKIGAPEDAPLPDGGMSAGDQKRAKLAAANGDGAMDQQPSEADAQAAADRARANHPPGFINYQDPDRPQGMPGSVYGGGGSTPAGVAGGPTEMSPTGVNGYPSGTFPDRPATRMHPDDQIDEEGLNRTNEPITRAPNAPYVPPGRAYGVPDAPGDPEVVPSLGQMYRQPLNQPTQGADTATGEYVDPDQGPRESGYRLPAEPAAYGAAGDEQGQQPYVAPSSYNDPTAGGTQTQPMRAQPSPSDDPGGAGFAAQDAYSQPVAPQAPAQRGALERLYDTAGNAIGWVQAQAGTGSSPTSQTVPSYAPQAAQATERITQQQTQARDAANQRRQRMSADVAQQRAVSGADAQAQIEALITEARQLIESAPDDATAEQIRAGYSAAIRVIEQQSGIDRAAASQSEMTRQNEIAESETRAGQQYTRADRNWDALQASPVGSAIRAGNRYSDMINAAAARPVTDIMGEGQLGEEAAADVAEIRAIQQRYGMDPSQWPPDVYERAMAAQRRANAIYEQGGRYASERAPGTETARTAAGLAIGAATIPLMPPLGEAATALRSGSAAQRLATVGRVAASAAIDPMGTATQGLLESPALAVRGARSIGSRVRGALADNAVGAARADAPGVQMLGSGVVPGESRRMYHGTAGEFARPDPGKFDENGLFGPGYYLTSDTRVAGGYAESRGIPQSVTSVQLREHLQNIAAQTRRTGATNADRLADSFERAAQKVPDGKTFDRMEAGRFSADAAWDNSLADVDMSDSKLWGPARAARDSLFQEQGANIRAIDVPSGLRMLDADAPVATDDLTRITETVRDYHGDDAARRFAADVTMDEMGNVATPTGERLWRGLRTTLMEPLRVGGQLHHREPGRVAAEVNEILQEAGFDGIAHQGGKRVPMKDTDGNDIMHDVNVIFPHALDKIRNAFSGEAGGAGVIPAISPGLRAGAYNAAQGGVLGAASEDLQAQSEGRDADPAERTRRAIGGAGLAVLAGNRGARQVVEGAIQRVGSGFVPGRRPTVEMAQEALTAARQAVADARKAVGAAPDRASRLEAEAGVMQARAEEARVLDQLQAARRSRQAAEPAIRSEVGPRIQDAGSAMNDADAEMLADARYPRDRVPSDMQASIGPVDDAPRTYSVGSGFVPAEDAAAAQREMRAAGSALPGMEDLAADRFDPARARVPGATVGQARKAQGEMRRRGDYLPELDDPLRPLGPGVPADADRVPVPQNTMREALPGIIRSLDEKPVSVRGTASNGAAEMRATGAVALPTMQDHPGVVQRISDAVSPWANRVNIIRYAGMLSDTAQHVANIAGGVLSAGADIVTTPIAATLDAARVGTARAVGGPIGRRLGTEREVFFSEVPARLRGMRAGASIGLRDALDIMKSGIREADAAKLDKATEGFGSGNAVVDFAFEAPLRGLAAADAVFRTMAGGGHLMAEATAAATKANGGKTPTAEMIREAAKDPKVLERVKYLAARSVLQEDRTLTNWYKAAMRYKPESGAGQAAMSAAQAAASVEIPFVKTPYNVVAQGVGLTPAGLLGVVQDMAEHKPAREIEHRVARVALGTALMAGAASSYAAGNLTGPRPTDQKEASTLPPGWQPWSRKHTLPDGTVFYQPLSVEGQFAVPAVVAILAGEAQKKGKGALSADWAGQVAMGVGRYAEQATFFEGVANISKMFDERTGERNIERNVEQIAAQFSPHVIGGGALGREIQRVMGMPMRDPAGAIEAILATHPAQDSIASAVGRSPVEPRQDTLGRPVVQMGSNPATRAVSTIVRGSVENDASVIRAFRKAGEGLPMAAPKQIRDPEADRMRSLTPQQQHRWRRVFGAALNEGYTSEGRPSDAETLRKVESAARSTANDAVLGRR